MTIQIDKIGAIGFFIGIILLIFSVVFEVFTPTQAVTLFLVHSAFSLRTT